MVVRLRLARHGTRNNPFYHIVVIRDNKARNARPIEKVGEYDPVPRIHTSPRPLAATSVKAMLSQNDGKIASKIPGYGALMTSGLPPSPTSPEAENHKPVKRLEWNEERIKYWLSNGVQPSKPVARLLSRAGLVPEGVHYKGIFRPPQNPPSSVDTQETPASPSPETA